ncbi:sin3 histone deacetylase corepressor complex component SDS3-like [Sitophilus oryzae]|uniref:Sin3 histone deacetylase corepressor complex component SDS3-like n=1 Tax=Sitophilus oryzae TaxID=7048 RepID=A0A6J2XHQ9_SITOR|nr:sin3 histone deacetylase corepressor complex component SDS3-like [Sitophilus oryzae]
MCSSPRKGNRRKNLISDLEDKKKNIEAERFSIELTGDSMKVEPIPLSEKRRKAPAAQITYLLKEKEIETDLRQIKEVTFSMRRLSEISIGSPNHGISNMGVQNSGDHQTLIETRIEDEKLLYEKRWFHRGQSIFVEGKDQQKKLRPPYLLWEMSVSTSKSKMGRV